MLIPQSASKTTKVMTVVCGFAFGAAVAKGAPVAIVGWGINCVLMGLLWKKETEPIFIPDDCVKDIFKLAFPKNVTKQQATDMINRSM